MEGVDPERRARLMELLDIDPSWRLNRVSDGQRRRVQICMGLLKPYQARVLLFPLFSGPGFGCPRADACQCAARAYMQDLLGNFRVELCEHKGEEKGEFWVKG